MMRRKFWLAKIRHTMISWSTWVIVEVEVVVTLKVT